MNEPAHILLIEDEQAHAELVQQSFEFDADRFYLTVVYSLDEAREVLAGFQPDLVITDLMLPDGLGTELLPSEKESLSFPVIVITSYGDQQVAVEAMKDGALDYVVKSEATLADMPHIAERGLREWGHIISRKRAEEELRSANRKILEQQKALIEEERLKVLLQMAGATVHELNQPLMTLLCGIELMMAGKDDPDKLAHYAAKIENAGERISGIVKKIQNIRHYDTKPYAGTSSIINIDQGIKLLSVEDDDGDFEIIKDIPDDYNQIGLSRARGIKEALEVLESDEFDLILLDHILPDGNGLDFLTKMGEKGDEIPVVVITGKGDEMTASQLIKAGASDYLLKHKVTKDSLSRSINKALEKSRLKREVKMAHKKMAEVSTRDDLTGLCNRRHFMETLEGEVARDSTNQSSLVLCIVNLDDFKRVNDTYAYSAGDMVLVDVSKMLTECFRASDLICRYGGDEFAVIFSNAQLEKVRTACKKFREMVASHEFEYKGSEFHVTASIGITLHDSAMNQSFVDLIAVAEHALYQAKEEGRNAVVEYTPRKKGQKPKFGEVLISHGYVTEGELKKGLSEQRLRLGALLVQVGRITTQQLNQALELQKKLSSKLGDILKKLGHATDQDIRWALDKMKRKLGEILNEKQVLTDYELHRALTMQQFESRRQQ
ncbi:MAG: diguanylate cyclase [Deltaproteobacteria bacterium]|nr:diguanylate cyclase [Deltaproteobacteria bacterium]